MRTKTPNDVRSGFSLIEIMVALVVIAVGLIAIVGLIPQGIQSSRSAADNTLSATIVHDTFNELRRLALVNPWPPLAPPAQDIYYDVTGTNGNPVPSDRYYHILLTPQATPTLLVVTAVVTWPAKSAAPANTNVFVTEIANYQQ
jgi:uncharacterized protein (TIGR02598 family)